MVSLNSAIQNSQPAILVVENNRFLSEMMCEWLERAGYTAHAASDEAEALTALGKRGFDIVLLNLDLHRNEGLSLLASVESKLSGASLILLTGAVNYDDVLARIPVEVPCVKVGKPYSFFALGLVIKSVLTCSPPEKESTPGPRSAACC